MTAATQLGHGEAEELFSPYVDRELPPAEEAALRAHLAGCPSCRAAWAAFSRAVGLARDLPPERPPAGFARRVLGRVRARRRAGGVSRNVLLLGQQVTVEAIVPVLVAVFAALVVLYLLRS
jgi:anti-sigma factor RsiW